jgi:hypothetical protein
MERPQEQTKLVQGRIHQALHYWKDRLHRVLHIQALPLLQLGQFPFLHHIAARALNHCLSMKRHLRSSYIVAAYTPTLPRKLAPATHSASMTP